MRPLQAVAVTVLLSLIEGVPWGCVRVAALLQIKHWKVEASFAVAAAPSIRAAVCVPTCAYIIAAVHTHVLDSTAAAGMLCSHACRRPACFLQAAADQLHGSCKALQGSCKVSCKFLQGGATFLQSLQVPARSCRSLHGSCKILQAYGCASPPARSNL